MAHLTKLRIKKPILFFISFFLLFPFSLEAGRVSDTGPGFNKKINEVKRVCGVHKVPHEDTKAISSEDIIEFYSSQGMKTRGIRKRGIGGVRKGARKRFQNILFAFNSHKLMPGSYAQLHEIGIALKTLLGRNQSIYFVIEGYTDNLGSSSFNRSLSYMRAREVKTFLVNRYHLSKQKIVVLGLGEERPVASNRTELGRRKNRRVEIILKQGKAE